MVTTSNHVLVNMADFVDDHQIEGDVLSAKRSHEEDDTWKISASIESDAEERIILLRSFS